MNSSSDWKAECPPWDSQYSALTHTDVQDCEAESFCHLYYMLTGTRVSPRALAVMAHLENPNNRNATHVLAMVNQFGLVHWADCPTPDSFTMASYYTPLTPAENKPFPVTAKFIPADLSKSPLWTEIAWGLNLPVPTRHMVAQINTTQYFDSEIGAPIKPLNYEGAQVVYQTSLTVTKPMQFKTQNYKGELRIVLQADDIVTWDSLCKVYGVDPTQIDEVIPS